MSFVPPEFDVPRALRFDAIHLEPLTPVHNERDHEAWMSSIDHIRSTPGFPAGDWPTAMTLEKNLKDLERHARHFEERRGFTYSVLDGDAVVGCVYIYPTQLPGHDAEVSSWVTASRAELDRPLYDAVSAWLAADWPFESPFYASRA